MKWWGWVLIGIALSVALGALWLWWDGKGLEAELAESQARVVLLEENLAKARAEAKAKGAEAAEHRQRADAAAVEALALKEQRDASRADLVKARRRIKALAKPKNLDEAMATIVELEGHVALLDRQLTLADQELAEVWKVARDRGIALRSQAAQIAQLEQSLRIFEDIVGEKDSQIETLVRISKRDRRRARILAGVVVIGVGVVSYTAGRHAPRWLR